jgi:hypothetical protein
MADNPIYDHIIQPLVACCGRCKGSNQLEPIRGCFCSSPCTCMEDHPEEYLRARALVRKWMKELYERG